MIDDLKKAAEDPIREAAKRMMEDFNAAFGDLSPAMRIAIWSSMTALKLIDLCAEAELAEMKERGLEPDPLAILRRRPRRRAGHGQGVAGVGDPTTSQERALR